MTRLLFSCFAVIVMGGCENVNESRAKQAIAVCQKHGGLNDISNVGFAECSDGTSVNLHAGNWSVE